jgi:hypothetical protein
MNESRRRGTYEQRKAEAIAAGRKPGALGALQREQALKAKMGKDTSLNVQVTPHGSKRT